MRSKATQQSHFFVIYGRISCEVKGLLHGWEDAAEFTGPQLLPVHMSDCEGMQPCRRFTVRLLKLYISPSRGTLSLTLAVEESDAMTVPPHGHIHAKALLCNTGGKY